MNQPSNPVVIADSRETIYETTVDSDMRVAFQVYNPLLKVWHPISWVQENCINFFGWKARVVLFRHGSTTKNYLRKQKEEEK